MSTLRSRITVKVDGKVVPGFPYSKRLEGLTYAQPIDVQIAHATNNIVDDLGIKNVAGSDLKAFLVRVKTGAVEMRFGANTAGLYMVGGMHAGFDINASSTDTDVNNLSTTPATRSRIHGILAGVPRVS